MTALLERVRFMGGNGGEATADAPELPPLDLGPDALEPDPQPAPETRSRRAGKQPEAKPSPAAKQPRAGGKFVSSKAQVKDLADELDSYAKLLALTWSMSDEHCASVLNETSAAICADFAALAGRSEWVMEKFRTTSLLGDLFKLIHHAWPLIRAINAHHGTGRTTEQEEPEHEPVTVVDPGQYGPWRPQVA